LKLRSFLEGGGGPLGFRLTLHVSRSTLYACTPDPYPATVPRIGRTRLTCFLLAAITLALYWPVTRYPFSHCDDQEYVVNNTHIHTGVNGDSAKWAFQHFYSGNWHPLTWMSHALDVQLFGGRAGGHHLTNILLHAANTVLLFLVLRALMRGFTEGNEEKKGATEWKCAFVAALFAWHPLHVESVAWISERKDVLSTFCFLLTIWAYARYTGCRGALTADHTDEHGLLQKETEGAESSELLQKETKGTKKTQAGGVKAEPLPGTDHTDEHGFLQKEMEGAESSELLQKETKGTKKTELLNAQAPNLPNSNGRSTPSFPSRITHHASFWYVLALLLFACGLLSKGMLVTLPFVLLLLDYWPLGRVTGDAWRVMRSRAAWSRLLVEKLPFFALTILACVATVWAQQVAMMDLGAVPFMQRVGNVLVSYALYLRKAFWPNDLALFYYHGQRSISEILLAAVVMLAISGLAIWQGRKRPYLLSGWCWFLGALVPVIGLVQVGYQSMADRYTYIPLIGIFIMVAWGAPDLVGGLRSQTSGVKLPRAVMWGMGAGAVAICAALIAVTHQQIGYWRSPIAMITRCVQVEGPTATLENDLASQYEQDGDLEEAIAHYRRAIATPSADRLEVLRYPQVRARINLAGILASQGKYSEAATEFRTALDEMPVHWQARSNLGDCLLAMGQVDEAVNQYRWACRIVGGRSAIVWHRLGVALARARHSDEALNAYRQAVRLKPDGWEELNDLAWILATDPHAELRDGAEAVRLAQRAVGLTGGRAAQCLGTLDAAYAEAGRFEEAIGTAHQAQEVAMAGKQMDIVAAAGDRIELYKQQKPFHLPQTH
jgi:tetratricopeptide (TPR) repeat protein